VGCATTEISTGSVAASSEKPRNVSLVILLYLLVWARPDGGLYERPVAPLMLVHVEKGLSEYSHRYEILASPEPATTFVISSGSPPLHIV
jgi:hypothetical protein